MSALLTLNAISAHFGGVSALNQVSLAIDRGQIVSLLGPNGAGKTTLIRAALGIIDVEGQVALGGSDPRKLSARDRALRAAYLPQRPQSIWPISVEALVALGRYAHGAAPDRLGTLDQAAVDAAISACSLNPIRTRGMDQISGGEKARAHLARALAQRAPLLMLDEPTAGLDPAQSLGVAEILRAQAESGGAVLFSTHDIALAAGVSHRVLLMKEGRVIADGPPEAALVPSALETAYGVPARLERLGDAYAAIFIRQSLNAPP